MSSYQLVVESVVKSEETRVVTLARARAELYLLEDRAPLLLKELSASARLFLDSVPR